MISYIMCNATAVQNCIQYLVQVILGHIIPPIRHKYAMLFSTIAEVVKKNQKWL